MQVMLGRRRLKYINRKISKSDKQIDYRDRFLRRRARAPVDLMARLRVSEEGTQGMMPNNKNELARGSPGAEKEQNS